MIVVILIELNVNECPRNQTKITHHSINNLTKLNNMMFALPLLKQTRSYYTGQVEKYDNYTIQHIDNISLLF